MGSGGTAPCIPIQMEISCLLHAPSSLPTGNESPGTHYIGGWIGPRDFPNINSVIGLFNNTTSSTVAIL
jgi:hypothetical protein